MIPSVAEVKNLQLILNQTLTLHLYGNNVVPAKGDTIGSYNEIVGGGYAAIPLTYASWTITAASGSTPTRATHASVDITFTGPINAPGNIYGYYVTDANGDLFGSERFSDTVVPFNPVLNSRIRITPRYVGG
jgi:hypothetical protein